MSICAIILTFTQLFAYGHRTGCKNYLKMVVNYVRFFDRPLARSFVLCTNEPTRPGRTIVIVRMSKRGLAGQSY